MILIKELTLISEGIRGDEEIIKEILKMGKSDRVENVREVYLEIVEKGRWKVE